METCFISKKSILPLQGEVGKMDPYVLEFKDPEDDKVLNDGAIGYCYSKHLASSVWAEFWGNRQRAHFVRNLGLSLISEIDQMSLWLNLNREIFILLYPFGVSVELPGIDVLEQGELKEGFRFVSRTREMNLHHLPIELAAEIKTALEEKGEYSLLTLAERLEIVDCFEHPQALATSKLVFDEELKIYWTGDSISSMCTFQFAVPEAVVKTLSEYLK
jgi:hypothetical protein